MSFKRILYTYIFYSHMLSHTVDKTWLLYIQVFNFVQSFSCVVKTLAAQQTQNICITFIQRRTNVFDVGPTLYKCYTNGLCLPGGLHSAEPHISKREILSLYGRLALLPQNYLIWIFTHLKLCLADAIHNFKWVEIIQVWQNEGKLFWNLADWCQVLSSTC